MVIMCLDHTRDYFHLWGSGGSFQTMDMELTTPALYFTRYITHFCAPIFVFLSGTSAFLQSQRKSKKQLSWFLFTRGLWLVVLEVVLNNFLWNFDFHFGVLTFQVIWAIGACMMVMAALIHLPKYVLLVLGIAIVAGHNLLDGITVSGDGFFDTFWYLFHQFGGYEFGDHRWFGVGYPMLPWLGIMILGYSFGQLYKKEVDPKYRRKMLYMIGLGALLLFIILRTFNLYGDPQWWFQTQDSLFKDIVSFTRITKYPPSLHFTLVTIGVCLILLAFLERFRNKVTNFFLVFGRVPLFFYFTHIAVIHLSSMLLIPLMGRPWYSCIGSYENWMDGLYMHLEVSLRYVYLAWALIIALLYYPSLKYMQYKAKNKDKKWLSYF